MVILRLNILKGCSFFARPYFGPAVNIRKIRMKRLSVETEKKSKDGSIDFLRKIFEPEKPLAKLIRTETASGYHLYDTGTNKILQCRKEVFELVQKHPPVKRRFLKG